MNANYPIRNEYGSERSYLDNGTIAIIVGVDDMSNRSLDLWAGMMLETIERSPDPVYSYLLLDLRALSVVSTTYSRVTVADVMQHIPPHRKLIIAIIVEQPVFDTIVDIFLGRVDKVLPNRFVYHNFSDVDAGVDWLREERDSNNPQ